MLGLIRRASDELVRRRFSSADELRSQVYAALVAYLEERNLLRVGPFDAAECRGSEFSDLDENLVHAFVRDARERRSFPISENAPTAEILIHLNLLSSGLPTHAAILLFGRNPQRHMISSCIKCSQFHGTEVEKPIPSYQIYQGTVFALVEQALNFVLARINLGIGTRSKSTTVPVTYEIPREVITEAIVNAVAHRDYSSSASVQVMLFADRLEIWNPGSLPSNLTPEKLRGPHGSFPANPLLATPMYLARYIEQMGTGTRDMIRKCRDAGLQEPRFTVPDGFMITLYRPKIVTGEVRLLIAVMTGEMNRTEMMASLNLKAADNFRKLYLVPGLETGLIEMTIPDKPNSSKQRYRLSKNGAAYLQHKE